MTPRNRTSADVAIIGGGIAGLWLLNLLDARGYSAILLERHAFGEGQTIHSQGIVHGGLKYALGGALTAASEALAHMPTRWRDCIEGNGEIDLRGVRVLSNQTFLWSANDSMLGRLGALLASQLVRGRVRRLARNDRPPPFTSADFGGVVYELDEFVLDPASLLDRLATMRRDRILHASVASDDFVFDADGVPQAIRAGDLEVSAGVFVLAAGSENGALIAALTTDGPTMQRRPLHQLVVRGARLPSLYGHCIDSRSGAEPRATITSHTDAAGERVWYVGGAIAANGRLARAHADLAACVPWIDLGDVRIETVRIDRAEPGNRGHRPDDAFVRVIGNVVVCWPTKLALAPALGDKVLAALTIQPGRDRAALLPHAAQSLAVAIPPWNR